jgi:hypothetical protein
MLRSYKYYDKPIYNDICVAMCFFSPVGYKKPINNITIILEEFKKANIPVFVIELLYPNQTSIIPNSFVVRGETILFSKENLWNLLEKRIPDQYSKIIFMDSDVLYSKPSWFNDSSILLENNNAIQCMEWSHKDIHSMCEEVTIGDDPKVNRISFAKAIKLQLEIDLRLHHMGFCIGIRRDFMHKINGFFEYATTGYGDTLFWSCLTKDFWPRRQYCSEFFADIYLKYVEYREHLSKFHEYPNGVDYVSDCLGMHLYHGSISNRRYTDRQHYIPSKYEFYHNNDGVLEIKSFDETKKDLKQYWIDRKEDE